MRKLCSLMFGMLGLVAVAAGISVAGGDDKVTIKQVMKTAMKGGLTKTVASGNATSDEKKELVTLFEALAENTPPRGDRESWKEKTEALLTAARGVQENKAGATDSLKKAANCKACHDVHKGEE